MRSGNLGSEKGASVREVVDMAARITGKPIPTRINPRRPGDPARLVADATRAKRRLGWCPGYDSLEQQIVFAVGKLLVREYPADADDRLDRLTFIECLLEEYRMTKDRRLLRRAIELWNEVEAERAHPPVT